MITGKNKLYSVSLLVITLGTYISRCTAPLDKDHDLPYELSEPSEKYVLQHSMKEVSGLCIVSPGEVALIEDEDGILFFFNLEKGKITRKISFAAKGDFEDLQVLGDTAYILRSDGTLFQLAHLNEKGSVTVSNIFRTGLTRKNNTEGLCYDKKKRLLLIACKNNPGEESKGEKEKAIYSYNPDTRKLSDTPVVRIPVHEVEKMAFGVSHTVIQKFMRFYRNTKPSTFHPSGISISPVTGDLYIVSSIGNLLVVVDSTSKIKHAIRLSPKVFKQPEGIGFDAAGNLYISNEGRKGKGNVLKFNFQKK